VLSNKDMRGKPYYSTGVMAKRTWRTMMSQVLLKVWSWYLEKIIYRWNSVVPQSSPVVRQISQSAFWLHSCTISSRLYGEGRQRESSYKTERCFLWPGLAWGRDRQMTLRGVERHHFHPSSSQHQISSLEKGLQAPLKRLWAFVPGQLGLEGMWPWISHLTLLGLTIIIS
jgi:hypothetical protein